MNRLLFFGLAGLLVLAPLPLGSNREWAWTLCAFIAALIAIGWDLQSLFRPRQVSASLPPLVIFLFLTVCAWTWLQTVALFQAFGLPMIIGSIPWAIVTAIAAYYWSHRFMRRVQVIRRSRFGCIFAMREAPRRSRFRLGRPRK